MAFVTAFRPALRPLKTAWGWRGDATEVASIPDAPTITSPLDGAVDAGDTVDLVGAAANDEAGVTLGVWRSDTTDSADAVQVEGYTAITGVDGTATIADVPKA